jgi:hypothetical protein
MCKMGKKQNFGAEQLVFLEKLAGGCAVIIDD